MSENENVSSNTNSENSTKSIEDGQESITIQAYHWEENDVYTDIKNPLTGKIKLTAWCFNRKSEACVVYFDEFPAMCHIELPYVVNGRPKRWTQSEANKVFVQLTRLLGDNAPYRYNFIMKQKYNYYQKKRVYPFLLLAFRTRRALYRCRQKLIRTIRLKSETLDFDCLKLPNNCIDNQKEGFYFFTGRMLCQIP